MKASLFLNLILIQHYSFVLWQQAEVGCFLKTHQGRPPFIFDCYTEYAKLYKNIRPLSLLAAANAYGFQNPMTTEEKTRNRDLIIKQNTWTKKSSKQY